MSKQILQAPANIKRQLSPKILNDFFALPYLVLEYRVHFDSQNEFWLESHFLKNTRICLVPFLIFSGE